MGKFFWSWSLWAAGAVSLLAQPVITNPPANQIVIYGSNATFSVMVTGAGPFTYQWRMNGTNLPNNIISTVAGGPLFDGLATTNTVLKSPTGVARDSAGNLYVAESANNIIRKISTNGQTTVVAGNGSRSFSGDGGPATNAGLALPIAVAVDTNGNLFIADNANNLIRKVDTNGIITTYAGMGMANQGFSGDGGQATNAMINIPYGLAVDAAGNLFIADSYNSRIRKVAPNGSISTVAGTGTAGFYGDGSAATSAQLYYPYGVAVDAAGNIYIADSYNYRIRKVTASTGKISTIGGSGTSGYSGDGGSATAAKLSKVKGLSVDALGNVFIADSDNNCIRKITNGIISTIAGTGTNGFSGDGGAATSACLAYPYNSVSDLSGNLFIADALNNRIRKIDGNGVISTFAGTAILISVQSTNATLNSPWGLASDNWGNFYFADQGNHVIRKLDTNGLLTIVVGNGSPGFSGDGGQATNASLYYPNGVAVDTNGNIFIGDLNNQRIRKVNTNGIISTLAGTGVAGYSGDNGAATGAKLNNVNGLSLDRAGNLFIADTYNNRIRKVATNGTITTFAGNGNYHWSNSDGIAATSASVTPYALCLDAAGRVYIGDAVPEIRMVDTNGTIKPIADSLMGRGYYGDGGPALIAWLGTAFGMAIDSTGNLFLSDVDNSRIRKIGTNGIINTIAGNGVAGFSGDYGPGNLASISFPCGIVTDAAGNVLFVDSGNNRIRKLSYVDYANQPSFTVPNVTTASSSNNYSVIITSASGSVTSSVVSLSLQLPPVVPSFSAGSNVAGFTWSAVSNLTYQLQYATNLAAPVWQNLGSPITATNGIVNTSDFPGADSQRFYRVQLVQ